MARTKLPVVMCPKCFSEGRVGRLIVRATLVRTQKSKYFPHGRPLGELRRYRYCNNIQCDFSITTHHISPAKRRQMEEERRVCD